MPPSVPIAARHPGSLRAGVSTFAGRPVVWVEVSGSRRRGALSAQDGLTWAAAADHALALGVPLLGVVATSGADVHEGVAALDGWGRAAQAVSRCSGRVPVLLAATGPAVSGPALLLGLADQVVMTRDAYAFVSGPRMVEDFTGELLDVDELGGSGIHAVSTGLASMVVGGRDDAITSLAALLDYLPTNTDELPSEMPTSDPANRPTPEAGACIPPSPTGAYDVRDVARAILDDGILLELRAGFAPNLVTALGSVAGRPVGIVANQPLSLAGTLDIAASQKGARFVGFCDSMNLPLVTLVDTPGFFPGRDLEWRGMIRKGAQLAFAYARASVPRVAVVLRKAYGGAYIVMDCRTMGSDAFLAWPSAEIAVMGARGAIEVLHRDVPADQRDALEASYEARFLNPYVAADRGAVDAVIDPADTRRVLSSVIGGLGTKRELLRARKHDNSPL